MSLPFGEKWDDRLRRIGYDPKKDYCSCSPDGFFGIKINDICAVHDDDYWKNGPYWKKIVADTLFGFRIVVRGLCALSLIPIGFIYCAGVLFGGGKAWSSYGN